MIRSTPDYDMYGDGPSAEQADREALHREMRHVRFNLERALTQRKLTVEERKAVHAALTLLQGVAA